MMILTDPEGVILATEGDARAMDLGCYIHLERGGRWAEADIGTNAIGTAIVAAQPVQIHGAEHFCERVHQWTCAAAPVRHPGDDELIGVVDISGPAATFNQHSLALAVATSGQIEAELGRSINHEHEILVRRFLSKRALWLSEELIILDHRGSIVHATERALADMSRRRPGIVHGGVIRTLKQRPLAQWQSTLREILPNASTELVHHEGSELGAIIALHGRRRPAAAASSLRSWPAWPAEAPEIVGDSPAIKETREYAGQMALSGAPVLLEGETGVGKELFARLIHHAGSVSGGPFVPVNCGGVPRELMGSELFGYAKGAFTGAREEGRAGKVEAADNGVLCLDEIGDLPLDLQPYLLRVLEDGEVYRIGSNEPRRANIRLVSMTNRSLKHEIEAGRFRQDLYYRIAVLRLRIPPLRERGDDVMLLAEHFARAVARRIRPRAAGLRQ